MQQWIFGGKWIELAIPQKGYILIEENSSYNDDDDEHDSNLGIPIDALLLFRSKIISNTMYKRLLKHRWYQIDIILKCMQMVLRSLTLIRITDNDSLKIIETNHPSLKIFVKNYLFTFCMETFSSTSTRFIIKFFSKRFNLSRCILYTTK